jgi:hypothetical protein
VFACSERVVGPDGGRPSRRIAPEGRVGLIGWTDGGPRQGQCTADAGVPRRDEQWDGKGEKRGEERERRGAEHVAGGSCDQVCAWCDARSVHSQSIPPCDWLNPVLALPCHGRKQRRDRPSQIGRQLHAQPPRPQHDHDYPVIAYKVPTLPEAGSEEKG